MVAGDPPQPKKRLTFWLEKFFKNLMAEKEKTAQHKMTVTAEMHKPTEKTPMPRKQPTPTQCLPFGKMPQKDSSGSSSSSAFSSVVSPHTKEIILRNVPQLIAQNVFKARELERQKDTSKEKESDIDDDIKVVAKKHGEIMRGAVGAVKELVQKQAGRVP